MTNAPHRRDLPAPGWAVSRFNLRRRPSTTHVAGLYGEAPSHSGGLSCLPAPAHGFFQELLKGVWLIRRVMPSFTALVPIELVAFISG